MEVVHDDDNLSDLELRPDAKSRLDKSIVTAYRLVLRIIRDAVDERDLRSLRGLRFKKLKGERSHQHSMRLNDQWRLILEIEHADSGNIVHVVKIEDYH